MAKGTRKEFLAAASVAGASMLAPATVLAQGTSPSQSPAPSASPSPAPSAAARAFAERMRSYDAALSDEQIEDIAKGVDYAFRAGKDLRKKDAPLTNGDAPSPQFAVNE